MRKRLTDELKVYREVQKIHKNPRLLREVAFYPAHDKRKETPQYKAAHHHLVVELDLPCLVCGVKNSTLKDKKENRYSAKQLETHHHVIEWALANAISVEKFNARILPHLRHRHSDRPEYKTPFSEEDVRNWVDHHEDNLWVICDVHHRAAYFGIHEITFPIWGPMDLLRDDFENYVKEEIAALKKQPATKKSKKAA